MARKSPAAQIIDTFVAATSACRVRLAEGRLPLPPQWHSRPYSFWMSTADPEAALQLQNTNCPWREVAGVAMLVERFSTSGLARSYVDLLALEGKKARVVFRPGRGHELNPFVVEPLPASSSDDGQHEGARDGADT